jgi:DNA-binding ferritin-like protein
VRFDRGGKLAGTTQSTDTVAERMVALGGVPDGSAPMVAQRSGLSGLAIRTTSDGEVDEPVTADLRRGAVMMLEEQLWMIRAQNITS